MASTELSQSLLDIIASLTQDDIPFKLRCAICNNLAINAFRLPCCDQAICETCQSSLPESCPVCEHNPVSPDLCKPNKALRTTLKAFLRTEEKKREKDRPSTTPAVTTAPPPAPNVPAEIQGEPAIPATKTAENAVSAETIPAEPAAAVAAEKPYVDENEALPGAPSVQENGNLVTPTDENGAGPVSTDTAPVDAEATEATEAQPAQSESEPNQMFPNMGAGMAGMMPGMGWGGQDMSAMAQFMPNAMGNFPNTMGIPGMGPMNAAQGMFGGFGMNMNNMSNGMNMGYGTEQQMYNNWDNSQNNMYNPNPYSNGMGQDHGTSGYAGYMSQPNGNYSQMQQYPNQNFQNGYYGNGYMRGTGRGRGRGFYRGRGGYDHANYYQQNYQNNVSQEPMNQDAGQTEDDIRKFNNELAPGGGDDDLADGPKDSTITGPKDANAADSTNQSDKPLDSDINGEPTSLDGEPDSQLQGIPTIDSIDSAPSQPMGPMGYSRGPMPGMDQGYGRGRGFGRGGFMGHRGGFYNNMQGPPAGQGVAGAPLAPRAMREGINRGGLLSGSRRTASISQTVENSSRGATPTITQENVAPHSPSVVDHKPRSYSPSRERSPRPSRPQSPPTPESRQSRNRRRDRSESARGSIDDRDRKDRHRRSRRDDRDFDARSQSRSRSPSERRSSHRPGKDRDHKSNHRSSRARRHGSRSLSRHRDRGSTAVATNGDDKYDLARRIANAQRLGKGSSSRHEKDSRKRDRPEREKRHDHESDRGTDRDRDRRRERDKPRDKARERDREKDRKRSRRDRSQSGDETESSRRHSRRTKRSHRDANDAAEKERPPERGAASGKDPHTLEREARNRERLMKEKQRRDAMTTERDSKSSRRQHDRETTSGRRLNYKYEGDDDDMSRVEAEREAGRWR